MRYLSLFSGIEAATVAWQDFGWECVGVSEIDAFSCELLQQRHPTIHNFGDITQITKEQLDDLGTVDIVVGGSPCQSFSTAGNRGGLEDPRGKLMYDYIRVVRTVRPKWFVWENVPGVLSLDGGRAFGTLLREMADIGYSLCWRVLDAQHFGVPQRRRRVFLVGHIGTDTECAAKVLFDPEGRNWNLKKIRQPEQDTSCSTENGTGTHSRAWTQNSELQIRYINGDGQLFGSLCANSGQRQQNYVHQMLASGGNTVGTLLSEHGRLQFADNQSAFSGQFHIVVNGTKHILRRLTPIECERLQGFPDNYTQIQWRKKSIENCPDGHRYKALGNSMAVPVMKWIGHNIKEYDERYYLPW
jgi:DNA (cytosine-5)-methyltransferase 1